MTGKVSTGLTWLDPGDPVERFPDPERALPEPDGLLAAGGDLSPKRLLAAYRQGIFPWYEDGQPILWWSPQRRAVIPAGQMHISRGLRRLLRSGRYQFSLDQDCAAVIGGCAQPRNDRAGTWITRDMHNAYLELHRLGHVHSIEIWEDQALIGGLYGVALGQVFCGESMFSQRSNGSKIALACFDRVLHESGFKLMDCQMYTPHLGSVGALVMSRRQYLEKLSDWSARPPENPPWPAVARSSAQIGHWGKRDNSAN
jgi:leucyl/phenylalanyl-tRNA--protein transferase